MSFTQEKIKGIMVKHVHLIHATKEHAEKFKKFLLKDIDEGNINMVVNLSECEFIDSTFISALVTALKAINQKEGMLKIAAVHTDVQSVLELTGMFKVFEIYRSIQEAINSFKSIKPVS